jgi:hypothetical protein
MLLIRALSKFRPGALPLIVLLAIGTFTGGCKKSNGNPANAGSPAWPGDGFVNGAVNVLTYHNDIARTGQNLHETILTPASVGSGKFGKVGFIHVKGSVDAEPLYVSNLMVGGATHNVLFVATEHDVAYAFDAETFEKLWQVSLLAPDEITSDDRNCAQVSPEMGVTATPVIDLKSGPNGAIYIVAMSRNHAGQYFQRIHALDLTTGAELTGSPRTISGTFPGSGAGSVKGQMSFDPKQYKERAALLLSRGVIYTTWSSHCDHDPYSGWVIGYNESNLQQAGVLNLTPNGSEGAIWMSAAGPAADASGMIYLAMGNGTFETSLDANGYPYRADYGNAFVKISVAGNQLSVADYFTMHDTISQSDQDGDLGSGGVLLLPDTKDADGNIRRLIVGGGKDARIYVLDREAMGRFNPTSDKVVQELAGVLIGPEFGMPAYFSGTVFYGPDLVTLKAFPIADGMLAPVFSSQSKAKFDYPGTTPSISANGNSDGIVWAVEVAKTGLLHAYDPANLAHEYYNSDQAGTRDQFPNNKFITPMIANGRVYIGTPSGVAVFGLMRQ